MSCASNENPLVSSATTNRPVTHRVYLLVEQGQAPTLSDEYFRKKLAEGVAEADRGECRPWDVAELKADLMRRRANKSQSG